MTKDDEIKELKEKVIVLQNYNRVICKKLRIYEDSINRFMKITNRLKDTNKYYRKKVKKYEESNINRSNKEQ